MDLTIQQAGEILKRGDVVVMPSETVYGLAANASKDQAVSKIYALKKRPLFNPLIVHVNNLPMAERFGIFSDLAYRLTQYFWIDNPKPLTIIVNKKKEAQVSLLATAGLDTVAMRLPHHPKALELIDFVGFALSAPSANRSNHISPTSSEAVRKSLGAHVPLLEGGMCQVGIESTIIDLSVEQPVLLRPGGLALEEIEEVLAHPILLPEHNTQIKAPGMTQRHYAPSIPLRMNATSANPLEALLGFGPNVPFETVLNLSLTGDLNEAAFNLFQMLHALDREPFKGIAVMPIPMLGLGLAINDRLKRASYTTQENVH